MKQEKILTSKEIIVIGSMLFALFLGVGNMIFPPMLGEEAGTNIWLVLAGFLVTGVGLPLLAVVAIARSGGAICNFSYESSSNIWSGFYDYCLFSHRPFIWYSRKIQLLMKLESHH